jgi:hypothetical protein
MSNNDDDTHDDEDEQIENAIREQYKGELWVSEY